MPRTPTVTTRWTARGVDSVCNTKNVCPGVHDLDDRPAVHYVIASRFATAPEVWAWGEAVGRHVVEGEVLAAVPPQMSASGFMPITPVADPDDYAAMAPLMGPGEVLGTIPAGSWTLQEVPA